MIDFEAINKAVALTQQGQFEAAEKIYHEVLEKNPNDAGVLSLVGLFYVNIGNFDKASEFLTKACSIKETFGTISALGFAEYERRDYKKASEYLEKALSYKETADVYDKLISSLFEIKNYKKAVKFTDKMCEKFPDNLRSKFNRIKALTYSGKMLEAEKLCIEALKQNPEIPMFWFQLGYLNELIYSDDKKALQCYEAAAELGSKQAYYNIAVSYMKLQDFEKAETYYKKMLEYYPNNNDTISSLGMCYLKQKKFKAGYNLFFQRHTPMLARFSKNPWKVGDKIEDEVVILCDQGFGDHIQFLRYLPFIPAKKIHVASQPALIDLFKSNYPQFDFIEFSQIDANMQSMLITDLAYILGIDFEHIPSSAGYLKSKAADIKSEKLKVGLCWEAGSAGIRTMINRTINIKCFAPLIQKENLQIYSLQVEDTLKGCEQFPQMINLGKDFKNFSDTAKAIMAMDVVVTVDTSVAHLAGALGVKTLLLLPYASDWRWFSDNKTTPWYDSIKIFKQINSISWEEPINDIIAELEK